MPVTEDTPELHGVYDALEDYNSGVVKELQFIKELESALQMASQFANVKVSTKSGGKISMWIEVEEYTKDINFLLDMEKVDWSKTDLGSTNTTVHHATYYVDYLMGR